MPLQFESEKKSGYQKYIAAKAKTRLGEERLVGEIVQYQGHSVYVGRFFPTRGEPIVLDFERHNHAATWLAWKAGRNGIG